MRFTRSSFIGSHRDTGVWLGDNHAWWSHLLQNLKWLTSIPMAKPAMGVRDIDYATITMHGWLEREYTYGLYDDDGLSKQVSLDSISKVLCKP